MAENALYTPALLEHVSHPDHNMELACPTHSQRGENPSCGDDITVSLVLNDAGVIEDIAWQGTGCAVSKGSADIMSDLLIGVTVEEARELSALFGKMVRGEELTEDEREELDEAYSLNSISHMPARVKCAELAWRTMDEILK